jgi:hypothetical protein
MSRSSDDCPFYAGSRISDPRFFVGREESLKLICSRLRQVQPSSINIVGGHRTGKSSLLLHFVNTYQQRVDDPHRFLVVYLSLQEAPCKTQEKFYTRITGLLATKAATNLSWRQWQLQNKLRANQWTPDQFNQVIKELKNQHLLPVVCLDNFERLLDCQQEFPNSFYDNLRSLVDNNDLMIIVASCEQLDLYSKRKKITSDFFNLFHNLDLNQGFTQEEAETLVSLTNSAGKGLSQELQQTALAWGKREPLLLQLASRTLWEMQEEGQSLRWAEKRFQQEAQRFKFQPKSRVLFFLYKMISKIGEGILWFNKNRKQMQSFWVGLSFLVLVAIGLIAFLSGVIDWNQFLKIFGK